MELLHGFKAPSNYRAAASRLQSHPLAAKIGEERDLVATERAARIQEPAAFTSNKFRYDRFDAVDKKPGRLRNEASSRWVRGQWRC